MCNLGNKALARFWAKVIKHDGCWEWTSSKTTKGYGQLSVNCLTKLAHRISWEMHFGEIPSGMWVLHKCDNPSCVNPGHLFVGTVKDNNADKLSKGRQPFGSSHGRSVLSEDSVREIKIIKSVRGISNEKIARMFGVNGTVIGKILREEIWTHVV